MSLENLVYMANQIGSFFASQKDQEPVVGIADHIKKYWDPRMRKQIFAHIDAGGEGLNPTVLQALQRLKK